ncbi:MAG: DEAD/DEAH box helicase, partial [Chloroflexota bacterium]|nr:DEAD/DEAH box helicase [Chloroflexota bacterium]
MNNGSTRPLVVQGDRSLLLETSGPGFEDVRDHLLRFAELVKSPEYVHTYRITPLSLWNAAASGLSPAHVREVLERYSRYPVPSNVLADVQELMGRYGRLSLKRQDGGLVLEAREAVDLAEVLRRREVQAFVVERLTPLSVLVRPEWRGHLKQALVRLGWPPEDLAGYQEGEHLPLGLRSVTRSGRPFQLRPYQEDAVRSFWAGGSPRGGCGVVVLPCGAGKTVVGMGVMARASTSTLVITTSTTALRQWREELLDKAEISPEAIGEYSGLEKEVRPITLTSYQILTHRTRRTEEFPHFRLFSQRGWGLIIYDEVHLLPAPVFRITAELQATRRLGLTATLVREDGREEDVFSLIGPKKHDVPWKDLERQGWIAAAVCHELRLPLPMDQRWRYAEADVADRHRVAAENPAKLGLVERLVESHRGDHILVIGRFLTQLEQLSRTLAAPLITGQTPQRKREQLYQQFRDGAIPVLVLSEVGNFAVDLPDANVAIQVSGRFGSRQEEAQRLGRVLRPKPGANQAHFYSVV